MKLMRKIPLILTILNLLSIMVASASAGPPAMAWVGSMIGLAYALGWLMMVIMGIKWIIADSPNERADAKKGMIYIVIGLLLVRSICQLMQLYCNNVEAAFSGAPPASWSCDLSAIGC